MQILVNSDHNISSSESVAGRVEAIVSDSASRFADRITRIEVHLSDENGDKHGERDKRCMIEARLGGLKPIAVTHTAPAVGEAVEGAADKLERALEHTLGRLSDRQHHAGRPAVPFED
jgi:ribosome-associated translation inhibitor RaiA